MKKILFCVGVFDDKDYRYEIFNNQIKKRNEDYCLYHGFEYLHITEIPIFRDHYSWSRIKLANELISQMGDGDILANIDADMCIVDGKEPFITKKSFAYSIDTGNSHCLGNWTLRVNHWSRNLLHNLIDDKIYNLISDSELVKMWKEQGILYHIFGIKNPLTDDSHFLCDINKMNYAYMEQDYGFRLYEISELIENIEVLSSDWNVPYLPGDRYFICKHDSLIIRHWSGGQIWDKNLYNNPIKF